MPAAVAAAVFGSFVAGLEIFAGNAILGAIAGGITSGITSCALPGAFINCDEDIPGAARK